EPPVGGTPTPRARKNPVSSRNRVPYRSAVARGGSSRLVDHRENVVLGHDEVLFAVDSDFIAGVGGEQDAVAFLDLELGAAAVFEQLAVAEAEHLALLGLFLGRVGQDDAARRLLFRFEALDHKLVVQGYDFHVGASPRGLKVGDKPATG